MSKLGSLNAVGIIIKNNKPQTGKRKGGGGNEEILPKNVK